MKRSKYDGKRIIYVDPARIAHEGTVVGQSDDGRLAYVQSALYEVPADAWHFTVNMKLIPALLDE